MYAPATQVRDGLPETRTLILSVQHVAGDRGQYLTPDRPACLLGDFLTRRERDTVVKPNNLYHLTC